ELIKAGIPAVIAMQESIRDDSATRFARFFYPALAEGQPIGLALAEARKRLAEVGEGEGEVSDWVMPVLFTARPELPLFTFERQGQPRLKAKVSGPPLSVLRGSEGYFVGRQAEQRAMRGFLTGSNEKLAIVSGLGGFGKSTLAQRSLERLATHFRVVHILSCKSWQGLDVEVLNLARSLAQAGYGTLSETLEANKEKPLNPEQLGQAVGEALNAGTGLLVLDNFEDLLNWQERETDLHPVQPEVTAWLESLLLSLAKGRVLITSRYDFGFTRTGRYQAAIGRISLDKLEMMEAVRLMREYSQLTALPIKELIELYGKGIDNPQIIELFEAQRRQIGGIERQAELLAVQGKYSSAMLLTELYHSLPEQAQTLLRRSAVYREPVRLEFLSRQLPGAQKWLSFLRDRQLLRVSEVLDQRGSSTSLYSQHQSLRQFGLERLEAEEQLAGRQAAHQR
ncbi:MAG: CHAT domain-containing protein, partial [Chloroflexi bacterium]|nr:CHAT domain-containing protein [Chloroflexota bacterium]